MGVGVANADYYYLKINLESGNSSHYVFCAHKAGDQENISIQDVPALSSPTPGINFYSNNPLNSSPYNKLFVDARPVDSLSTFTLPCEGEDLTEPNVPASIYFENKLGSETNNVLAFFYDNVAETGQDPNWVYSGVTLDAQEAGKTPSVSYVTVPVKNGLSNIMQVKFFPPEDVNFSGTVDLSDFSALASNWQIIFGTNVRTAHSPTDHPEFYCDINKDGSVGLADLVLLSQKWLWEKPVYAIDAYDPINPPAP
jgi:hypothetical protein